MRLSEFGNSAYVLDVFAFVMAADWNDFLAIKEDLNLRIAEIVRDSRDQLRLPLADGLLHPRHRCRRGARGGKRGEVRQWREEKRLPFPDYDFAERAEMADTLPFPPEDSPDYRPSPPRPADEPVASGGTRQRDWLRRRGKEPATTSLSGDQRPTRRPRRAGSGSSSRLRPLSADSCMPACNAPASMADGCVSGSRLRSAAAIGEGNAVVAWAASNDAGIEFETFGMNCRIPVDLDGFRQCHSFQRLALSH